jgi:CheY-like chemotaxis protein
MGGRILVIDDSTTIRRVVGGILSKHGYEPVLAPDGVQGLEVLRSQAGAIDLVLVDFVMPRMTGLEFCQRLRSDEQLRALPVVLMSARTERIRDTFASGGATDAISKPFDARALVAVIEGAIERVRAGKAPRPSEKIDPPPVASVRVGVDREPEATHLVQAVLAALGDQGRHPQEAIERAVSEAMASVRDGGREVLRGWADAVPLGEVMQVLQMQMQSGVLVVRQEQGAEARIHFRQGLVDLAEFRGGTEEFRVGRYLLSDGAVSRETLEQAAREATETKELLGNVLVKNGQVQPEQLQDALLRQSSEIIYEVIRWQGARYVFLRDNDAPKGAAAELGLPIASLVMEGFRRVDEWRLIEESIDFEEIILRDSAAIDRLGVGRLGRLERLVLDAVDGERTVRQVVQSSNVSSFEACKIVYQFLQSRLVRRKASA